MSVQAAHTPVSFFLPIPCQICLEKVTDPCTCCNQHVFCKKCIDHWLERQRRCPVCRVEITTENPIKPIIGGDLKSDMAINKVTQRQLRKTRMEILVNDYDEEVVGLEATVEKLSARVKELEASKMKADAVAASNACVSLLELAGVDSANNQQPVASSNNSTKIVQTDVAVIKKEKLDLEEKIKEQQSKLETLQKENSTLKEKMMLLSPTKLSRVTVATLESQLDDFKKENHRLRKALTKSDSYIDQLQAQIKELDPSLNTPNVHLSSAGRQETTDKSISNFLREKPQSLTLCRNLNFDQENSQPLSVLSVDEQSKDSVSYFTDQRKTPPASTVLQNRAAIVETPVLELKQESNARNDDDFVFENNVMNDLEFEDMNSNTTLDCENLLRQFDSMSSRSDTVVNSNELTSNIEMDDFIEPSSSSTTNSELRFTQSLQFEDPELVDATNCRTVALNEMYSSPLVEDDVLLSQNPKKQANKVPLQPQTLMAGTSRINMSRLSPEDQRLFDRPKSAPSKTFLLNSNLFSSIQQLDDNGMKMDKPTGASFSLRSQFQPIQPHKKTGSKPGRSRQKTNRKSLASIKTTASTTIAVSTPHTNPQPARPKSVAGNPIIRSPYNCVSPDEVMFNDRKLIRGIAAVVSSGSAVISATCTPTVDARGKNMYRVNILKKGSSTSRCAAKRSIPLGNNSSASPSPNNRGRRKQKLTEKPLTSISLLKSPSKLIKLEH